MSLSNRTTNRAESMNKSIRHTVNERVLLSAFIGGILITEDYQAATKEENARSLGTFPRQVPYYDEVSALVGTAARALVLQELAHSTNETVPTNATAPANETAQHGDNGSGVLCVKSSSVRSRFLMRPLSAALTHCRHHKGRPYLRPRWPLVQLPVAFRHGPPVQARVCRAAPPRRGPL
jgi:hypothetical protein